MGFCIGISVIWVASVLYMFLLAKGAGERGGFGVSPLFAKIKITCIFYITAGWFACSTHGLPSYYYACYVKYMLQTFPAFTARGWKYTTKIVFSSFMALKCVLYLGVCDLLSCHIWTVVIFKQQNSPFKAGALLLRSRPRPILPSLPLLALPERFLACPASMRLSEPVELRLASEVLLVVIRLLCCWACLTGGGGSDMECVGWL